jgi:hypothetical protein
VEKPSAADATICSELAIAGKDVNDSNYRSAKGGGGLHATQASGSVRLENNNYNITKMNTSSWSQSSAHVDTVIMSTDNSKIIDQKLLKGLNCRIINIYIVVCRFVVK